MSSYTLLDPSKNHLMTSNKKCYVIIFAIASLLVFSTFYEVNLTDLAVKPKNADQQKWIRTLIKDRQPYECPTRGQKWAIITTINYPTNAIKRLVSFPDWIVLIVADKKTPKDWYKNDADLEKKQNLILLTLEQQMGLDFELIDVIPTGSYARKNIGYLCAMKCGAEMIYETDDDNMLMDGFKLESINLNSTSSILEALPPNSTHQPLVNPYALFGRPDIWPRGFPLSAIKSTDTYEFFNVRTPLIPVQPWIQQRLADLDPDVDAIYRLTQTKNIGNITFKTYPDAIAIGQHYFSPFNTQNTIYLKEAFWGILIPFTTSFRVCDIWRGYWVQRLLWDVNGALVFRPASVKQIRNAHNYSKDFEEEIDLYMKTESLVEFLTEWRSEKVDLFERIKELGQTMADHEFWSQDETRLINAWVNDLKSIGYIPPKIPSSAIKPLLTDTPKRTAVCLTGQLDRLSKAWPKMLPFLDEIIFQNNSMQYDLFYYISTYKSSNPDDEKYLKTTLRPAYGILYNDPPLSPNVSSTDFNLRDGFTPKNVFQQLYALKRCYEMVEKYSQESKITYEFMIRLRTDHYLINIKSHPNMTQIWKEISKNGTIFIPYDEMDKILFDQGPGYFEERHGKWVSDRMAMGTMEKMTHYMMRYDYMNMEGLTTLHAESFLQFVINHYNITLKRLNYSYNEIPE